MKFIKNKKGFLLGEETIKIIIAVLGIAALIYLLVSLYFNQQKSAELKQAESTLRQIVEYIELSKTEGKEQSVPIFEPQGWKLLTYGNNVEKPSSCKMNCICICPKKRFWQNQKTRCAKDGFCISVAEDLQPIDFEIKPMNLIIEHKEDIIHVGE